MTVHRSTVGRRGPLSATPVRRPDSVVRTTTHDSVRPDGRRGPILLTALGRDLRTESDGSAHVLGAARVEARVEQPGHVVTSITSEPAEAALQALVGIRASAGFRSAVAEALPGARDSHSVHFQLLDDLPTALLVSGYALMSPSSGLELEPRRPNRKFELQHPDMCAGWISGGVLMSGVEQTGLPPPFVGPIAPSLDGGDDPLGWHETPELPAHGMRRRRRIDVWEQDGLAWAEAFFRDSHMAPDGVETVVHEYSVHASVDPATLTFVSCRAEVGALPWPECPAATVSASRLVGTPVAGLRRRVREEFVGTRTCTHLNDTLRALEDVDGLLDALHQTRGDIRA